MEFLLCTLLGIGGVLLWLLGIAVLLLPCYLVGCGIGKVRKRSLRFDAFCKRSGSTIGGTLLALFLCGIAGFLIVAMHDVGCSLRGHPEHAILKDDKPKTHSH